LELIGPYLIGCVILILAGAMKAFRPGDTARGLLPLLPTRFRSRVQLRQLGLVIRLVSFLEVGLGLVALVLPRPVSAAMVAASYIAFAAIVAYARSQGGALASCGCFGTPDTPATFLHALLDIVLGITSASVAVSAPRVGSILGVLSHQPLHGAPLVLVAVVGAWLTYLTLSVLSALHAARLSVFSTGNRP
jgi:hypothetical protein